MKFSWWSMLKKIVWEVKGLTFAMLLLIFGSVTAALFPPLVLERAVNLLAEQKQISLSLALLYFGLLAAAGILESGQNIMITMFGQRVTHRLRSAMCRKLKTLPAEYYTKNNPGEITSRFVNDVGAVDTLFTNGIVGMFADACKVISILVIVFYKSPGLGLVLFVLLPLLFGMTRMFQKRMLAAQLDNRVAIGKVNNHVPETIHNIRMIHTLSKQRYMEEKYDQYIQQSYQAQDRSNVYDSIYSPIVIFVSSCVIAVMMISSSAGAGISAFFGITVGTAVAMISYVGKIFDPLESIGMEIQNIQSAAAGVKRIQEFLQEPEFEPAKQTAPIKKTEPTKKDMTACRKAYGEQSEHKAVTEHQTQTPCVEFRDVTFSYGEGTPVLNHLSFAIQKGEMVIFTGRTGAGKSTIFKLISGLYQPQGGEVLVCGQRADAITEGERRHRFGYVEQNFKLADGTIAEQISLFDSSISVEEVKAAARLAGLHEMILELPYGYETPASEVPFSQGQFQLLSIARAAAAQPEILLLDEITANLDSETEHSILAAIEQAAEGRTVISISHRLAEGGMHGGRVISL